MLTSASSIEHPASSVENLFYWPAAVSVDFLISLLRIIASEGKQYVSEVH